MKLSALTPDTRNANRGTDRGRKMVRESLKRYGAGRSILIDKSGNVIAGNKTLEGAQAIGLEDCQIVKSDGTRLVAVQRTDLDINDKAARELAIADNRASELGLEWDPDVLKALETEVDVDLSPFWDERELVQFWAKTDTEPPEPRLSQAPELAEKWQTQPGQIWTIGKHRLMCGDATSSADVARLCSDRKASICFTSPPYSEQRNYGKKSDATSWDVLMRAVFAAAPLDDETQVLVNLGLVHQDGEWVPYWYEFLEAMREMGWRRFAWYVWDQGPGLPGDWNGRFAPAHEFVFHFNKKARRPNKTEDCKWAGETNHGAGLRKANGIVDNYTDFGKQVQDKKIPDSVLRIMRHKARGIEIEHPAVFPRELPLAILEAYTSPGQLCYEPFAGSGTQICAAEACKRTCYALEIEPKYVAVALQRLADMGLKPELTK